MKFQTAVLLGISWMVGGCDGAVVDDDDTTEGADDDASDDDDTADDDDDTQPDDPHLLISEVGLRPGDAEFIEIWNRSTSTLELDDYYLTDNSSYTSLAAGEPWEPAGTPETDFLARFPAGTSLAADAVLVVALSDGFEATFASCPDLILAAEALPCGGVDVPPMQAPPGGGIGTSAGSLLSNSREMVMLFTWDGDVAHPLQDVDYLTWGVDYDDDSRVDKTGVAGYAPDTPRAEQDPAPTTGDHESLERCGAEIDEEPTGGNGLTGHDETSESMSASFSIQVSPGPGTKNACL